MSRRLSENLSSLYLGAAQRMKSKAARKKIVAYVESYDDVFFWRAVLEDFEDEHICFEVMLPSRESLGKGKKKALTNKLGPRLGKYMIACVDADYDYLMQDATPTSRMINSNPYVFHTYAYAIENYQCYAPTLHRVCVMATLNDRRLVDFEEFMRDYSVIIWPLFVWSAWVYKNNVYHNFTITDLASHISFSDINIYHPERTLEAVRRNVNRKLAWMQRHYPQAKHTLDKVREELLRLGLTPETTYLYVQGHMLFTGVIAPLLEPVCAALRKEREKEIRALAEHDIQMQNELSGYRHSQEPLESMLRKNVGFKEAPPYKMLQRDLRRLVDNIQEEYQRNCSPEGQAAAIN